MFSLKKKTAVIFILFTLVLSSIDLKAQDFYNGDFRFGLGIAPNISWFSPNTDVYQNNGNRTGWSWGLNMDFFFAENYAFSTGLKMLNYGGKLSYPDLYNDGLNDFKVTGESNIKFNAKYSTCLENADLYAIGY